MNDPIDILLSTYNGESYLEQQIDSIVEQKYTHWHLIIRDDGSTDNTKNILLKYSQLYPEKIDLLEDSLGRVGPSASFGVLLAYSGAPYVSFSDQDDVWLPDKLVLLKACIQREEDRFGSNTPLLVHSDLEVVGADMSELSCSFWKYQHLNPVKMQTLERLLLQNCVTGCATLINRALVNKASPVPETAIMHDWWCALLAVSLGHIMCIKDKTVKYRQHSENVAGAKKWGLKYIVTTIFTRRKKYRKSFMQMREQAISLVNSRQLKENDKIIVTRYIDSFNYGWFRRRAVLIRMGFLKYGVIRNLALLLWF